MKYAKIIFLATFSFAIYSCNKNYTDAQSNKVNYTDEQIFKGIAFMDGPVAYKIPEISEQLELVKPLMTDEENTLQH